MQTGEKKVLLLSYGWEGRRAFQTVVCLSVCVQVCVWRGESLCVLSIFGGGFLSALEEQRA